jgi:hypothetical protein
MSRSVSSTFKAAAFAPETDQIYLLLLVIDHADLAQPIRVVNNYADVVSNGDTYIGCPFEITLPPDNDESLSAAQLAIQNVDRQIVQAVREIDSAPDVTLSVVLAASPNTIEAGPYAMTLRDVSYDALVVTGSLSVEDMMNEPYPGDFFTPGEFPGLF